MTTEERLNKVLHMLEKRSTFWHNNMLQYHDEKSAAVMTAYNSAYMMLYCAMQGYDEELAQFDYYEEENKENV